MEELISKAAGVDFLFPSADRKFLRSIGRRIKRGHALTTRQGWASINMLRKNVDVVSSMGIKIEAFREALANPQWEQPLVPSVEIRDEVRYLGDNMLGFRSSGSRTEIEFAAMKAVYSNGMKIVTIANKAMLEAVVEFIGKWGFALDDQTEQFLGECFANLDRESHVMLDGDTLVFDIPNEVLLGQFAKHILGADYL